MLPNLNALHHPSLEAPALAGITHAKRASRSIAVALLGKHAWAVAGLLLLLNCGQCEATTLDGILTRWLKHPTLQHSNVGVEIMELPSGRVLYSYNGHKRFTPASTAKVFTTACAFETLGGGYTFKTQLFGAGEVVDGKLHGDLLVSPSQDPSFSRDDIRQLVAGLDAKKIHHIEGRVKLAATPGGFEQYLPGWLVEDFGQVYMPVCSNFVVDRNIAQGSTALTLKGVKVGNILPSLELTALNRSLMKSDVAAAWCTYDPGNRYLRTYCGDGTTQKSPLIIANPDEYNVALVESTLADKGIHVAKPSIMSLTERSTTAGATLLSEVASKPLSNIITTTLHESDNLYAQQLLRTLGLLSPDQAAKIKLKDDDTTIEQRGLYRMTSWMSTIGVSPQEAVLLDGCGLTRKNGVSPHALNTVLKHMATPTMNGPYISLLKLGEHNFRYKTGSMDTARSITGIVPTVGGQNMAVSILINNHQPSVKDLRASMAELVNLVSSISTITVKEPGTAEIPVVPTSEAKSVEVTLTKPAPSPQPIHRSGHRRRRHH